MRDEENLRELLGRMARLLSAADWAGELNPAQRGALHYLARANRFSRTPSHVADFLGSTRGTVSQSLKALERKGYVRKVQSGSDRRSVTYELSDKGMQAYSEPDFLDMVLNSLDAENKANLKTSAEQFVMALISKQEGRTFGVCVTCTHHRKTSNGPYCGLLEMPLEPPEAGKICHEHQPHPNSKNGFSKA